MTNVILLPDKSRYLGNDTGIEFTVTTPMLNFGGNAVIHVGDVKVPVTWLGKTVKFKVEVTE